MRARPLITILLFVVFILGNLSPHVLAVPGLNLTPNQGPPGTTVAVTGTGIFGSGDYNCSVASTIASPLFCFLLGVNLNSSSPLTSPTSLKFVAGFSVNPSAAGKYQVSVIGLPHSDTAAYDFFTVTSDSAVSSPTLLLSSTWGSTGETISVSGENYGAATICHLHSTPMDVFTSSSCAISSGNLNGAFTVSGAPPGTYNVIVDSSLELQAAMAPFSVVPSSTYTVVTTSTVQGPTITTTSTETDPAGTTLTLTVTATTQTTSWYPTVTTTMTSSQTQYSQVLTTTVYTVTRSSPVTSTVGGTTTTFQTQTHTTTQDTTVQRTQTATTTITPTASSQASQTVTQPPPSSGLDPLTIAGIIVLIAICVAGAVVSLFWLRRRRRGKEPPIPTGKASPLGRVSALSAGVGSPIMQVPVPKKPENAHVATATVASDGSIFCKSCGAPIQKGQAKCQICGETRSFSEQDETPQRQEEKIKEIRNMTTEAKVSKIGPLEPKEEEKHENK